MTRATLDTWAREIYCGVALLTVCYLAVGQRNEIATGAIIAFLASSSGYLFRSKLAPSEKP